MLLCYSVALDGDPGNEDAPRFISTHDLPSKRANFFLAVGTNFPPSNSNGVPFETSIAAIPFRFCSNYRYYRLEMVARARLESRRSFFSVRICEGEFLRIYVRYER